MQGVVLDVDGERFTVTRRAGSPGAYDFEWDSGPNAEYGFTSAAHGGVSLGRAELEESARVFLQQVDPATGYLADWSRRAAATGLLAPRPDEKHGDGRKAPVPDVRTEGAGRAPPRTGMFRLPARAPASATFGARSWSNSPPGRNGPFSAIARYSPRHP